MIFHRCRLCFVLAIGAVLAVSRPASADGYRNESRHFTMEFPNTWSPVPKDAIAKANAMANQTSPGARVNYVAGFQRRGQPPMSYPYVLVQPLPMSNGSFTYEEIEKALAKEFKTEVKKAVSNAQNAFPGLLKEASMGTPTLDRTTNRVVLRMELSVPPIGKIQGVSVGFLGAKDIVFLHCYARDSEFDKYLPTFEGMFESLQFDQGFEFTPKESSSLVGSSGGAGGGALRGALIGGIVGGLAAVPLWLMQKRRKAQAPSSGNVAPAPSPPPPAAPETGITTQPRPN